MRKYVVCSVLLLLGCGGGGDAGEDRSRPMQEDWDHAHHLCSTHGGLGSLLGTHASVGRSGAVIDLGLICLCGNGTVVRTPVRYE